MRTLPYGHAGKTRMELFKLLFGKEESYFSLATWLFAGKTQTAHLEAAMRQFAGKTEHLYDGTVKHV